MSEEIDQILNDEAKLEETVQYVFSQADVDDNNFIDASEFSKHLKEVYSNIGIPVPSDDDISKYMDELDTNKDGKLDIKEFKVYVEEMLKKDKETSS
ncbi:unnamed protein product [Moneuplotes crassus]|uniref:EF-hand domain-containing protein n=1 Tax=Euplotes crassus TaxID=5936 RepID=A0AAD1Y6L0_EUPCR|nr:unnamed protein product [Moneuplotes crassus]